ncbi:MAG: chemotaxis protein CheD [Spirochaetes bacterium]|nr:chemotaxis protein CheD [Spirochaetota bacterium]
MYIRNSHKLKKPLKVLYPGDCYVSNKDEYIGTLLGSCVAVCLYDPVNKVGGMNHFVLPGKVVQKHTKHKMTVDDDEQKELLKYGTRAIENLIAQMEQYGQRKNIVAKIFGGGKVLDYQTTQYGICNMNVRIAKILLEMADIPIVSEDVGGTVARKVVFDVESGRVYCKQLTKVDEKDTTFTTELSIVG